MNEFDKRILKDFDLYNKDEKDKEPRKVTDKRVADAKLTEKFEKKRKSKSNCVNYTCTNFYIRYTS